ncbi:unnamed protein product [Protopolystoma xenopodis]|uniref:Uncharacterized protein n=1 Tax=Protopolystoma xenopodis TaxID=117903 RepID=A0A448XAV1_9PLAT|nr:unnamed protein product [Protopolystoma xenopodis]
MLFCSDDILQAVSQPTAQTRLQCNPTRLSRGLRQLEDVNRTKRWQIEAAQSSATGDLGLRIRLLYTFT